MSEGFVPLAAFLRPPPVFEAPELQVGDADGDETFQSGDVARELAAALSAIRRFRAGVADALDAAVQSLLARIAEDVLSRELRIAPPEIAAIVAKARERNAADRVIAVRVHPAHRNALATLQVDVHTDDRLAHGDAVLEVRSGTIDVRLRTRLAAALAACEP